MPVDGVCDCLETRLLLRTQRKMATARMAAFDQSLLKIFNSDEHKLDIVPSHANIFVTDIILLTNLSV
jgi:hypothetical protein